MAEHYHIDLSEPGLLEQRSGRWLLARILGLLAMPTTPFSPGSRLCFALFPPQDKET